MKIMETSCNTQCPQPCSRPQPTQPSSRDSWTLRASLGQSLVGSLLISPGFWHAQGSVCTLPESVPQSCGSSGSSVVGLMATSLKRSRACTAILSVPNPAAGHHQPSPLLETPGHSQASLGQSLVGSLLLAGRCQMQFHRVCKVGKLSITKNVDLDYR